MFLNKISGAVVKCYPLSWTTLRRLSDEALVVKERTGTSLNLVKKPSRAPFMKNIFQGVFDLEMLVYPELDKMDLEELKKRVEPLRNYFKDNVDPNALSLLKIIPNEIVQNLKNLGLFGLIIPSAYDGSDKTATEIAIISEIIAKDLNVALTLYSHNFLGAQSLMLFGSDQQKDKYLPRLASGEWIAAFCMSESASGSDIRSITTKAVPSDNPDVYLLNGKKQWVINGNNTNLFIVLANTDFRTHTGDIIPIVRGFLVERDSPGVTVSQPQEHVGLRASFISEVHFKDTPVHTDSFIGGEHDGPEMYSKVLSGGRYNIGAMTLSVLKRLMHEASEFITSRKQVSLNKPLFECEQIMHKFTNIAECIYTLESMTYHTAMVLDKYDSPDCLIELAIIKVFSFTEGRRSLDMIMDIMGGRAFLNSEITQKYFRDFRTMEVFDGTTDVTKLFIALTGLQHAGLSMNEIVSKMRMPYEYPTLFLKRVFSQRKQQKDMPKLNLKLFEQLHPSLTDSANELEYCVLRFEYAVSVLFHRYGPDVINQQIELMRLADAAVKIYAMTAVLGRSSRSYCIGLRNAEMELKCARNICYAYKRIVRAELNDLIDGLYASHDEQSLRFGPEVFRHRGYFIEHPSERSY